MEIRPLGHSGIQTSLVGLGCNNFGMKIDLPASRKVIDTAIEVGINCFDTADMYGDGQSEEFLGKVLGPRRKDIVLATKFGGQAKITKSGDRWGTQDHILRSAEESLRRINTDWIDVYQIHYPDPETPIEETLQALGRLVEQGKVRAIGHSNFSGKDIRTAATTAKENNFPDFVSAQNEWSLLNRTAESDVIPACDTLGVGQLPYFPLASGMLTGKYKRGEGFAPGTRLDVLKFTRSMASEINFTKVEALADFVAENDHTLLELAFSWLAAQSCTASVIAGATTPEQVRANAKAVNWKLSAAELDKIDTLAPEDAE